MTEELNNVHHYFVIDSAGWAAHSDMDVAMLTRAKDSGRISAMLVWKVPLPIGGDYEFTMHDGPLVEGAELVKQVVTMSPKPTEGSRSIIVGGDNERSNH